MPRGPGARYLPVWREVSVYNPAIRVARGRRWLQTTLLKSGFRYVADE